MSRIYESAEYYQKVKETGNALEREYLEEERWRRRDPFDDEFFNRGLSTHSNRSGSRFSQPSSHRNLERSFVDERDIEQTSSRMRSYRNEIRVDDCAPRQRSTPAAYMDEPPVYSIINSRPSDYSSRTDFHEERSQQQELTRSRPGSPQVVAGPGEIINTEHGFTIELDVKHFRPHDIKVIVVLGRFRLLDKIVVVFVEYIFLALGIFFPAFVFLLVKDSVLDLFFFGEHVQWLLTFYLSSHRARKFFCKVQLKLS
uniref:SHSP domain-containing protein n=1 Tax=Parascaris univalens TaxID=6257 RepID=A0A915B3A1_PARUN